jgi:hypothetical protein
VEAAPKADLRDTDGFVVESPNGEVGWVEELWLGEGDEPRALAVQTVDGRHALLRADDVEAVEREQHWVVVRDGQELLELGLPRITTSNGRIVAVWETTGAVLRAPSEPSWHLPHGPHHEPHPHPGLAAAGRRIRRWPAWVSIAILYSSLLLIGAALIAVAFLVSWLVTGSAY